MKTFEDYVDKKVNEWAEGDTMLVSLVNRTAGGDYWRIMKHILASLDNYSLRQEFEQMIVALTKQKARSSVATPAPVVPNAQTSNAQT